MSDHESTHSEVELSPTPSHTSMKTEALHDHRHQADSLPIRRGSVFDLPPPAVPTVVIEDKSRVAVRDEDYDSDSAIQDSPIITPKTPIASNHTRSTGHISSLDEQLSSGNKRGRSKSFSDQIKSLVSKEPLPSHQHTPTGILLNKPKQRSSKGNADISPVIHPLNKTFSRTSRNNNHNDDNDVDFDQRRRRLTRSSLDSDDSKASRESQETEEDVCFPMVPEHVKINGIDFDEIDEFLQETRQENIQLNKEFGLNGSNSSSSGSSTAAARYTPKIDPKDDGINVGVSFGSNKVEGDEAPPDRFSFFCSESEETVHAPDIISLIKPGETIQELFRNGQSTWWLDCICPTDAEMKVLAKAFGIHPLTAEDIRMQETREKVELFRSYYFVCFHTFESDNESEDFLEPINVYIVVFRNGVLTFHFNPISHAANVRRRVRQLRDYVDVSADWLCYALIDDITDSFAPVIHAIEYEADAIEDQVFLTRNMDLSHMLQKIGESRRKVMTLMRLLSGKADVIKMFAKRCQDEAQGIGPALTSSINLANLASQAQYGQQANHIHPHHPHHPNQQHHHQPPQPQVHQTQAQPRADIALYLGDIQDHVITMYQNLLSYEKIFSRSHSNYLAQLQVESFYSNNKVTEMLSKVTLIGTILVPLNLITGLFGMNVTVPGQEVSHLGPFFGILGFIILLVICFSLGANWWLTRKTREQQEEMYSNIERRSVLNWARRDRQQDDARNRETRSVLSYPSRINRYD